MNLCSPIMANRLIHANTQEKPAPYAYWETVKLIRKQQKTRRKKMTSLVFGIGLIVGVIVGMIVMCCVQINRGEDERGV